MKEIPVEHLVALVDDEDYENVLSWAPFRLAKSGNVWYAHKRSWKRGGVRRLHHIIIPVQLGMMVDHIDGDGLNNQRSNLRVCSCSENQWNARTRKDNKSGIKGVSWHKQHNKWYACIQHKGKQVCLGLFRDLDEAKAVVETARARLHGEFANNG